MDTTRENVERWIGVLQSEQFDQTPELAPILSALAAERDTLKALCVEWKPIETAPQCGVFLVYLEAEMLGSRIHVANWHLNVKIVGGVFSFDAPNPTHWQPLPPPPCGSEGK